MRQPAWFIGALASSLLTLSGPVFAQLRIEMVASEGVHQISFAGAASGEGPALSDDGTLAFAGSTSTLPSAIFVGDPEALWPVDLVPAGLTQPRSVRVNADTLAFVADAGAARGVFACDRSGGPIATVYLARPPGRLPAIYEVGLSRTGAIALASVCSDCGRSDGAVYTGSRFGQLDVLQRGTPQGPFLYNSQSVDINDRGQVAVQAEYLPAYRRAIFVLERPNQPLAEVTTVVEGLPASSQPRPSLNERGEVAYVLDGSQLWVAAPTPFGAPKSPRLVADTAGAYAAIERAELDDHGKVVFLARLDDGRRGIFVGPDPAAHKVIVEGEPVGGTTITRIHAMGQLNGVRQLALIARAAPGDDARALRISGVPAGP